MEEIISLGITKYELIFLISATLLFTNLIWNFQKKLEKPSIKDQLKDTDIHYVNGKNLLKSIDEYQENMLNSK
tara:strand:+ start:4449 stop:4667 length:219 start_codon:yes stop_codon:yes gene_type:complete